MPWCFNCRMFWYICCLRCVCYKVRGNWSLGYACWNTLDFSVRPVKRSWGCAAAADESLLGPCNPSTHRMNMCMHVQTHVHIPITHPGNINTDGQWQAKWGADRMQSHWEPDRKKRMVVTISSRQWTGLSYVFLHLWIAKELLQHIAHFYNDYIYPPNFFFPDSLSSYGSWLRWSPS